MYIQYREHYRHQNQRKARAFKGKYAKQKYSSHLKKWMQIKRSCYHQNDSLPSSKAIIKSMEGPVHRIGLPAFAQTFAELKDAQSDKLRSRSGFLKHQAQNMKHTKVFVITASLITDV